MTRRKRLTEEQWERIVRLVGSQEVAIDEAWAQLTRGERQELLVRAHAFALEQRRLREQQFFGPPQKAARKLLRSLLTPEQRRELGNTIGFKVRGSAGGVYKLYPWTGLIVRVESHNGRWYEVERFCWHEDEKLLLPPADRAIAELCMLRFDEERFLAEANASPARRRRSWAA